MKGTPSTCGACGRDIASAGRLIYNSDHEPVWRCSNEYAWVGGVWTLTRPGCPADAVEQLSMF